MSLTANSMPTAPVARETSPLLSVAASPTKTLNASTHTAVSDVNITGTLLLFTVAAVTSAAHVPKSEAVRSTSISAHYQYITSTATTADTITTDAENNNNNSSITTTGDYYDNSSGDATAADSNVNTTTTTRDYERSAVVHALWVNIIVLGALGNGVVIYTLGGRNGERSATNCYIINLAVSDFAVLTIIVPFTITMFTSFYWLYGEAMCKATAYLIFVTLQATCLTLTAMTIDRYYAIVHPITSLRDRTPRRAVLTCLATWLASSIVCIPFIVYSGLEYELEPSGDHVYCVTRWANATWTQTATIAVVMSTYVIPLSVIIVCYTLILKHLWRNKIGIRREMPQAAGAPAEGGAAVGPVIRRRRKVTRMVFTVVLAFAITWLPIHVFNLCYTFFDHFPKTEAMYNVKIFCHTLSYLNPCINPFIYAFLGDGFRRSFRKSFPRCTTRNQVVPGLPQEAGPSMTGETRLAGNLKENTRNICKDISPVPPADN